MQTFTKLYNINNNALSRTKVFRFFEPPIVHALSDKSLKVVILLNMYLTSLKLTAL